MLLPAPTQARNLLIEDEVASPGIRFLPHHFRGRAFVVPPGENNLSYTHNTLSTFVTFSCPARLVYVVPSLRLTVSRK